MSPRLILMRHAKSSWDHPGQADHERPLNERGRRSAPALGAWMTRMGIEPELVIHSGSARTRETWDLIAPALPRSPRVTVDDRIYLGTPEDMLSALATAEVPSVLLIGHNPGIAALAQWLVDETPDRPEFHRYPTGATLVLDITRESWRDLGPETGRVAHFVVPRDLTD